MRSFILRAAGRAPLSLKAFIYRRPWLLKPLARLLKSVVPAEGTSTVVITGGLNAGMKLVLDRGVPNYFWLRESYEPAMEHALWAALRTGMTAADVGAHMGFDTMSMSRAVGPSGRVLSFEPDPINATRLTKNCAVNGLGNVTIHRAAVAATAGVVRFQATGDTVSRIAQSEDSSVVDVTAVTLDEIVFQSPHPALHLVKIDVEGAELGVLEGARRCLEELRPIWLIECHSADALRACAQLLFSRSYRVESLSDDAGHHSILSALINGQTPVSSADFAIGHIRAIPT